METTDQMSDTTAGQTPTEPSGCACWKNLEADNNRKGMQFDPNCTALVLRYTSPEETGLSLVLTRGIPLVRIGKTRRQKGDPAFVIMKFCPFCGSKLR